MSHKKGAPDRGVVDDPSPSGALVVADVRQAAPLRLERETSSWRTLVLLSSGSVTIEVGRQVSSYAIKYYNADVFPLPSTLLVFMVELLKMMIILIKMAVGGSLTTFGVSFIYLVPSTLYAINNNIYYVALHYTTPAIWNILMQSRLICIAFVYRFYFKKSFTYTKWFGLLLLTASIVILQLTGANSILSTGAVSWDLVKALGLAVVGSIFAAIGPVFTEFLLKHDKKTFDEKQLQIYMLGSLVTGSLFFMQEYTQNRKTNTPLLNVTGDKATIHSLITITVLCSVAGGIVVANIIKKLDNIVKLYAQAVSSAVTAIACVFLFPLVFHFDVSYLVSFLLAVLAIYFYESPDPWCRSAAQAPDSGA